MRWRNTGGGKGSGNSERFALPIPDACTYSGLSRSGLYRGLAAREILAVKCGKRTLVLQDSLKAYLANLPAATFRIKDRADAE